MLILTRNIKNAELDEPHTVQSSILNLFRNAINLVDDGDNDDDDDDLQFSFAGDPFFALVKRLSSICPFQSFQSS